jgi:hypothetical protein
MWDIYIYIYIKKKEIDGFKSMKKEKNNIILSGPARGEGKLGNCPMPPSKKALF